MHTAAYLFYIQRPTYSVHICIIGTKLSFNTYSSPVPALGINHCLRSFSAQSTVWQWYETVSASAGDFNCTANVMWHGQCAVGFQGVTQCVTVAMCKSGFSEHHCYGNGGLQMKLWHRSAGIWARECPVDRLMPALNSFLQSVNNLKMLLAIPAGLQKVLIKHFFWWHLKVLKLYKIVDAFFLTEEV